MNRAISLFLKLLAFALLCLPLTGCQADRSASEIPDNTDPLISLVDTADEPLRVVTTIFPPYDFVRAIAGDAVELIMLLSPGSESHSFEPTPQDLIRIQECDIFLYVGGENDVWVERILESVDTTGIRLMPMTDLVDTVYEEIVEGMEHGHDHDDDHDHDEEDHQEAELDEHVWTSPANAVAIVQAITGALSELDPDNAAVYAENSASYVEELTQLDAAYSDMLEGAVRNTVIFGDRYPFRYLSDAYSLEYFAAFPGCSTETEASSATVAFLIDKVTDEALPVVFHIELSNEKMADTICEATGAEKRLLHSCHNLSKDDFQNGVTYLDLMRQNLEHLKEALY